ncbi:hypothetical protein GOP47_0019803 [Adiantum capillus-veneris]|uniref:Squalene cyclase N-terminal domain-containing protein n=1 Tax=Adiantum capillus-veneris TaxID=13818 RepID=A0A9D4Z7E0_ADICA|nr:hypothetical protein GOP47_0019803 [Adiantum capillus-veneris]
MQVDSLRQGVERKSGRVGTWSLTGCSPRVIEEVEYGGERSAALLNTALLREYRRRGGCSSAVAELAATAATEQGEMEERTRVPRSTRLKEACFHPFPSSATPSDSQRMAALQVSYRESKSSSNGDLAIANCGANSSCAEPVSVAGMEPFSQEYFKEEYAGYWWQELEANTTITSQTIILYKMFGIDHRKPVQKMGNYLKLRQCDYGGWELYYGDGGHLSATIEAYIALSLLHVPKTDPVRQKAYTYIISRGGISKACSFTKILLASIGIYDWKDTPSLPPWVVLFSGWFPFILYNMACGARGCVVPLMIICDKKRVVKLKPEVSFDELYAEGRKNVRFGFTFGGELD